MDSKPTDQRVEWNMAGAVSMEMARLREQSNKFFIARNLNSATECLLALRLTATHVFSDDELTSLIALEKSLLELISKTQKEVIGFGNNADLKEKAQARTNLYLKFIEYNTSLTKLLDSYGFLGSRQKDRKKLVA